MYKLPTHTERERERERETCTLVRSQRKHFIATQRRGPLVYPSAQDLRGHWKDHCDFFSTRVNYCAHCAGHFIHGIALQESPSLTKITRNTQFKRIFGEIWTTHPPILRPIGIRVPKFLVHVWKILWRNLHLTCFWVVIDDLMWPNVQVKDEPILWKQELSEYFKNWVVFRILINKDRKSNLIPTRQHPQLIIQEEVNIVTHKSVFHESKFMNYIFNEKCHKSCTLMCFYFMTVIISHNQLLFLKFFCQFRITLLNLRSKLFKISGPFPSFKIV